MAHDGIIGVFLKIFAVAVDVLITQCQAGAEEMMAVAHTLDSVFAVDNQKVWAQSNELPYTKLSVTFQ